MKDEIEGVAHVLFMSAFICLGACVSYHQIVVAENTLAAIVFPTVSGVAYCAMCRQELRKFLLISLGGVLLSIASLQVNARRMDTSPIVLPVLTSLMGVPIQIGFWEHQKGS